LWTLRACESALADSIQYLFRRLQQVGVESVHGVPGDYNLVALDYISKIGLKWVGNCNELNAGMWTSSLVGATEVDPSASCYRC
jgi:hypothetical protein